MKSVLIPSMVIDIITTGVSGLDGYVFEKVENCPFCGGAVKGHDIKKKKFATIIEDNKRKIITVNVKRSRCTSCQKLVYADSPFYKNIRMGSPLVDFCLINLKIHSANHISKILKKMNILVNPSTIRSLKGINADHIAHVDFQGIFFPLSLLNISEKLQI